MRQNTKKLWWHDKVAYQIYPKSFLDTNGDGIGDLRGIIEKLDYLCHLGIDIIWISPIYCSPFVDQGYDISDYYNIDPVFGSMADMDELLIEAKKRNMYILMDLVVNHCSDQHEWFQKAIADPDGPYGEYFYIREGKDGNPPCNWRSYFGGSVWTKIPGTNKYYLHMFAPEQPDLNWENPVVRQNIYQMMNWWLEKGLAGFRIDAIINIKKDLSFSDLPADREDGLCSGYKMLEHAEGIELFLAEMSHETFKKHHAFAIGELFNYKKEELDFYIGEDGCFSSIFDFSTDALGGSEKGWYEFSSITPNEYRDTLFASQLETELIGFKSNIIENHDEPRGVSRYITYDKELLERPGSELLITCSKKMLATITCMLRGLPFLYQGQEIGMTNCAFSSIEEINDISTTDEYHIARKSGCTEAEALNLVRQYSRDNARTPMQWNDEANAGFTTGTPWLMVNPNYKSINVENQLCDSNSILSYYKLLISFRKNDLYKNTLVYGEFVPAFVALDNFVAFYRRSKYQSLLILANYQNHPVTLPLDESVVAILVNNYAQLPIDGKILYLAPYQAVVLEVQ